MVDFKQSSLDLCHHSRGTGFGADDVPDTQITSLFLLSGLQNRFRKRILGGLDSNNEDRGCEYRSF